jgi:hypothetical protein
MTIPRFLALFLIGPIAALGILGDVANCILYIMKSVRVGERLPALLGGITVQVFVVLLLFWILKRVYFRNLDD